MASELVIGGDQPFVGRLIGVCISPMVGSIYNIGVSDKGAVSWVNTAARHTLQEEAAARVRYKETSRSLDNGGCTEDPHIVVDRCLVFLCILHCFMAMGCLQVARLEALPKDTTEAMQKILSRARTGVKLGRRAQAVQPRFLHMHGQALQLQCHVRRGREA